ncbi:MAG: TFIIB-type zinc ribbon-containing protein [Candidatus Bathyarchaeota archaeon]
MNILEPQCCPECKSSLVDDTQNGEVICSGCGVVVADQIADYGPETKVRISKTN